MKRTGRVLGFAFLLLSSVVLGVLWWILPARPRFQVKLRSHDHRLLFSPDSTLLAVQPLEDGPAATGPVRLWNVVTGKQLKTFLQDGDRLERIQFSPKGELLAVRYEGDEAKVLDLITGQQCGRCRGERIVLSPDGRRLALAIPRPKKDDGDPRLAWKKPWNEHPTTVALCDTVTGREMFTLGPGYPCKFSPDGRVLVTAKYNDDHGSESYDVSLWDTATGQKLFTVGSFRYGWLAHFSPDSRTLAVISDTRIWNAAWVKLLDVETGKERAHLPGYFSDLEFIRGGRLVAVLGSDLETWDLGVRCYETQTGKRCAPVFRSSAHDPSPDPYPHCLLASRDGNTLAVNVSYQGGTGRPRWAPGWLRDCWFKTSAWSEGVKLLDTANGAECGTIPSGGWATNFSPDGKFVAVGWLDGTVAVWDAPPRRPWASFFGTAALVLGLAAGAIGRGFRRSAGRLS